MLRDAQVRELLSHRDLRSGSPGLQHPSDTEPGEHGSAVMATFDLGAALL